MKYRDPLQIACPSCGVEGAHSVRMLLALQARCTECQASLATIGHEMRTQLVAWSTFIGKVETAVELEAALGVSLSDPELEAAQTGLDLVTLIQGKLSRSAPDLTEAVRAAVTATRRIETSLEQLRLPLERLFEDQTSS